MLGKLVYRVVMCVALMGLGVGCSVRQAHPVYIGANFSDLRRVYVSATGLIEVPVESNYKIADSIPVTEPIYAFSIPELGIVGLTDSKGTIFALQSVQSIRRQSRDDLVARTVAPELYRLLESRLLEWKTKPVSEIAGFGEVLYTDRLYSPEPPLMQIWKTPIGRVHWRTDGVDHDLTVNRFDYIIFDPEMSSRMGKKSSIRGKKGTGVILTK